MYDRLRIRILVYFDRNVTNNFLTTYCIYLLRREVFLNIYVNVYTNFFQTAISKRVSQLRGQRKQGSCCDRCHPCPTYAWEGRAPWLLTFHTLMAWLDYMCSPSTCSVRSNSTTCSIWPKPCELMSWRTGLSTTYSRYQKEITQVKNMQSHLKIPRITVGL